VVDIERDPEWEGYRQTRDAIQQQKLAAFREQQAMALDIQRAIDKDKKKREDAEKVKNLGRMSDTEYLEWRRRNCGF
jgi:hypothetical protein